MRKATGEVLHQARHIVTMWEDAKEIGASEIMKLATLVRHAEAVDRGLLGGGEYNGVDLRGLGIWATHVIQKKVDDPCIDNIRFACYGDMDDMEEYFVKRANGCCGFYDGIHRCPIDLKKYLVGCNYGH